MSEAIDERPRLRPVEAIPLADGDEQKFAVRDPTGIAEAVLTMSPEALFILSLLDGEHTLAAVQEGFRARYSRQVDLSTLVHIVENLRSVHLLDGAEFEAHIASLEQRYQDAPVRPSVYGRELGDRDQLSAYMSRMVPPGNGNGNNEGLIVGLIAPHLDYPRGGPCYSEAYGALRGRPCPTRCVILGTNHFGRSTSVVATAKSFETPLGVTTVDIPFLADIERRCGHNLRESEFDHQREHSIELQVICLQHLFGAESLKIVPFLCPDPCGPTGTRPCDGRGVDLADFAQALAETTMQDVDDTLLIAGADLSHIGRQFGDTIELDEAYLSSIAQRDRGALSHLEVAQPQSFVRALAESGNDTRVCSAGCLFVVATVLQDARPKLLKYHQAFTEHDQTCVTCSAFVYSR